MNGLLQDLRYSLRVYRKSPGFAVVAVLALAFGIGINSAIFTLLNAIALRPLPLREPGRVVTVYQTMRGLKERNIHGSKAFLSYSEYQAYRDQNHVFSGLAAFARADLTMGGANSRLLEGYLASCNYFDVLAEPLKLGRGFRAEECANPGASPVVLVSHGLWQRQFGGDAAVLGKTIVLNRLTYTIVGVAPEGFYGAGLVAGDVWAPLTMQEQWLPSNKLLNDPNVSWLEVAGRLRADATLSAARADMAVVAARIDQLSPGRVTSLSIDPATLMNNPEGRGPVLGVGAVILAAVSLVLLIACANLANLLLARAAARQKEIAVRLAVGATRGRLIGQLLTESVVVALAGGALGVALAWWTLRAVYPVILSKLPQEVTAIYLNFTPDPRILAYSLLVALATGVGFGLLPALQSSRLDLNAALKESISGSGGRSRGRLRGALVTAQIAVCLVLLIAAGLLARGLQSAQNVEPGFSVKDVVFAEFDLAREGYDIPRAAVFHRQLSERLKAYPGVREVAEVDPIPLSGSRHGTSLKVQGTPAGFSVSNTNVTAAYFRLLEIPVVLGRGFEEREIRADSNKVVVSESAARHFWPNENPLGKPIVNYQGATLEVIGVAKDVRSTRLSATDGDFVYFPAGERSEMGMRMVVRGTGDPAALQKAIVTEVRSLDANLLVHTGRLEENLAQWQLPTRILSVLALVLGLAGLLLASMGLYGVMAYAVSQRTREIGIRMTLGARRNDVLWMILQQSLRPVLVGVAIGLAGCAAVSRVMSSLLFGVSPLDPLVFGTVSVFLAVVAMLASYVPARRATKVDPMTALRYQ